jgi:hypothetical protein
LWQGAHPPFGYPHIGTPDLSGKQVVHNPVAYTKMLRFPFTHDECELLGIPFEAPTEDDKAKRTAQNVLCVYNV